jgi:hypothetical protein
MMAGCCRRPSRGWLEPAAPSECCRADFPPSRDAPADSPPLAEAVRSAACRLWSKRAVRAVWVMISPFTYALSGPCLLRGAVGVMLASVLTCAGCDRACRTPSPSEQATAAAWLSRDLARLNGAPPELQQRLQESPVVSRNSIRIKIVALTGFGRISAGPQTLSLARISVGSAESLPEWRGGQGNGVGYS